MLDKLAKSHFVNPSCFSGSKSLQIQHYPLYPVYGYHLAQLFRRRPEIIVIRLGDRLGDMIGMLSTVHVFGHLPG